MFTTVLYKYNKLQYFLYSPVLYINIYNTKYNFFKSIEKLFFFKDVIPLNKINTILTKMTKIKNLLINFNNINYLNTKVRLYNNNLTTIIYPTHIFKKTKKSSISILSLFFKKIFINNKFFFKKYSYINSFFLKNMYTVKNVFNFFLNFSSICLEKLFLNKFMLITINNKMYSLHKVCFLKTGDFIKFSISKKFIKFILNEHRFKTYSFIKNTKINNSSK